MRFLRFLFGWFGSGQRPPLALPPERTFAVVAESRAFSVDAEARTFVIVGDDRSYKV